MHNRLKHEFGDFDLQSSCSVKKDTLQENIKPTNQVSPQINVVSSPDKKENNKISNEFLREDYQIITNKEDLQKWYNKAEEIGYVAFDTETNSLDAVSADMVGFSLCTSDNDACYVPLLHINTEEKQIELKTALKFLKILLEDTSIVKILHNMKFDALVLDKYGITIKNYDDTMLLSYSLGSGGIRHKLDTLVKYYFKLVIFSRARGHKLTICKLGGCGTTSSAFGWFLTTITPT